MLCRGKIRLCSTRRAGAGPAQEWALPAAGRLEALVARAERSQPVRLRAQQLRQKGETFLVWQVRLRVTFYWYSTSTVSKLNIFMIIKRSFRKSINGLVTSNRNHKLVASVVLIGAVSGKRWVMCVHYFIVYLWTSDEFIPSFWAETQFVVAITLFVVLNSSIMFMFMKFKDMTKYLTSLYLTWAVSTYIFNLNIVFMQF